MANPRKYFSGSAKQMGLPPGALIPSDDQEGIIDLSYFEYSQDHIREGIITNLNEIQEYPDKILWVNLTGLNDIQLIEDLGKRFGIDNLSLEDILNTNQRPKYENYGNYLFFSLKMIAYNAANEDFSTEQVSIVVGKSFVISFQEREGDLFEPIRYRLRNIKGKIRSKGADYLAYALLDIIVDNYFITLENLGDDVIELEDELFRAADDKALNEIQEQKKYLLDLRRAIYPLREAILLFNREDSPLINKNNKKFINDLQDHVMQVLDAVEALREMNAGLRDVYLSGLSVRMNKTMQVLTIIATIFIPLTFIVGVYGMNFEYMPELKWKFAYPVVWLIMIIIAIIMIFFFRKKRWL